MKIRIDGVTAGIGTGILYGGTGWLAHIIVRPDFRRRGSTGRLQTRTGAAPFPGEPHAVHLCSRQTYAT
jgi:hypothetical protein